MISAILQSVAYTQIRVDVSEWSTIALCMLLSSQSTFVYYFDLTRLCACVAMEALLSRVGIWVSAHMILVYDVCENCSACLRDDY